MSITSNIVRNAAKKAQEAKQERAEANALNAAAAALSQEILAIFERLGNTQDGNERRKLVDQGHALILPHIQKGEPNLAWLATQLVEINLRSPLATNVQAVETALRRVFGGVREEHIGSIVFGQGDKRCALHDRFRRLTNRLRDKLERKFGNSTGVGKTVARSAQPTGGQPQPKQGDRRRHAAQQRLRDRGPIVISTAGDRGDSSLAGPLAAAGVNGSPQLAEATA